MLLAEHPVVGLEKPIDVLQGVLHGDPPPPRERSGHLVVVQHKPGCAREPAGELNAGILRGSFRDHELVDPVSARELREKGARAVHSAAPSSKPAASGATQRARVKLELYFCQLRSLWINLPCVEPSVLEDRHEEARRHPLGVARGHEVGLQYLVRATVLSGGVGGVRKAVERAQHGRAGGLEQDAVEAVHVDLSQLPVQPRALVEPPATPAAEASEVSAQRLEAMERFGRG